MPNPENKKQYITRLLDEIIRFRDEIEGKIYEDETCMYTQSDLARRGEIDSMLKDLPFDLRFWGFLKYGDYAEFWSPFKALILFSSNKKRKEHLASKYGLTPIYRPGKEIRLKDEDTDILCIERMGMLKVHLGFEQIVDLMEDVLQV